MATERGTSRIARARRAVAVAARTATQRSRRAMVRRAAHWVRSQDPKVLDDLSEVGLVRRDWLEGADAPITDAAPLVVVTRALEALVERRPSTLSALGLSTIRILAAASEDGRGGVARPLTVAFVDLEGFTAFTEAEGDEAARAVLHDYYVGAGRTVRSRGGRIVKRLGDGLLLTFEDTVSAALATVELVGDPPVELDVRAGIHAGEVLVEADDIAGHTVNVASRVADVATGGEILATAETAAQLPRDDARFSVAPAHIAYVRGLREPLSLHRLAPRR